MKQRSSAERVHSTSTWANQAREALMRTAQYHKFMPRIQAPCAFPTERLCLFICVATFCRLL